MNNCMNAENVGTGDSKSVDKYSVEAAMQGGNRGPGSYEHKGISFSKSSDYTRAASFR